MRRSPFLGVLVNDLTANPLTAAARPDDGGYRGRGDRDYGGRDDYAPRGTLCGSQYRIRRLTTTSTLSESRYPPREELPLPTAPPYTAFVGNLAFDISDRDVEEFFGVTVCRMVLLPRRKLTLQRSQLKSIKIIKDRDDRPKGFGYVEFQTLQDLKDGLAKSGVVRIPGLHFSPP